MKRKSSRGLIYPAAVAAVGATAAAQLAHAAPTVTFILSVDDNGSGVVTPGDFALYATDSIGDNYGIAGIGMDVVGNITSVTNDLPVGNYDDGTGEGNDDEVGFSLRHDNGTFPIGGTQDTADLQANLQAGNPPGYYMVYGLGQVGGNLNDDLPPGSTGPDGNMAALGVKPNPYHPVYAGPSSTGFGAEFGLLVANGRFSGPSSGISFSPTNNSANVFTENGNANFNPNGGNTEGATIVFATGIGPPPPPPPTLFSLTASAGNGGTDDAPAFGAADHSDVVTVSPGNGKYSPLQAVVDNNKGFFDYAGFSQGDSVDIALKFSSGGSPVSESEISAIVSYINANDGGIGIDFTFLPNTIASPFSSAPASVQSALGGPDAYDVLLSGIFGLNDPFAVYDFSGFTADPGLDVTGIGVVPEPASLCLLALGGLALVNRRRIGPVSTTP